MGLFARIGVDPGQTFRPDRLDPATADGLRRATEAGRRIIVADPDRAGTTVNGWSAPPKAVGNFGDDHLLRAVTAMRLLAALPPVEVVYLTVAADDAGRPLDGRHRYVLRFDAGRRPPADGFWSVTVYRLPERLLAANPIGRYSIVDRTKDMAYGADESLEVVIQSASPGRDREANWLPTPPGAFCVTLRGYLPRQALRDGTRAPPPVRRVE